MKILRSTVWAILALAASVGRCQDDGTNPGWYRAGSLSCSNFTLSDTDAPQDLRGKPQTNFYVPSTPIAETITPQIQALSDGLQHDPYQIFSYVHDHIKYVVYFGSKKGAQLTLLEKSGNDFDQCALLVALLRAGGYTNLQYQFAPQQIPYDDPSGFDLHHWWQLTHTNDNWTTTKNYLANFIGVRGYPAYSSVGTNTIIVHRIWVALTIGTTTYQLDPAFKVSVPVAPLPGFSLINGLGESSGLSNALLTVAQGTNTINSVQNLNEAGIRSNLATYTANFLNYIQTNAPNASMQDILGGWQIVPAVISNEFATTTRFVINDNKGYMKLFNWANQPTNLISTLKVSFGGTSHQWFIPELQGQRLSMTFDANGLGKIWLDDAQITQASTSGGTASVILTITHPIGSWDVTNNYYIPCLTNMGNMTVTNTYDSVNATFALTYGFEPDWGWLQQRQQKLEQYVQQGLADSSRQVISETLNTMGMNWLLQTKQIESLLASQLAISPYYYHQMGRVAQISGKGYYLDLYASNCGEYSTAGDDGAHIGFANEFYELCAIFNSALEHGVLEQMQTTNLAAASTVKMLQIANTNGQAIYLANITNWTSGFNVKSHLPSYASADLNIITKLINGGYSVLLPQTATNSVSGTTSSWKGIGYSARLFAGGFTDDMRMTISGNYQGGYIGDPTQVVKSFQALYLALSDPKYFNSTYLGIPDPQVDDPVSAANGTFELENADLTLGQPEPRGITFSRYYDGTRRFQNLAGLGPGWLHNYIANANTVAAPFAGLGGTTPAQSASAFVATTAALAVWNQSTPDPKNWLTTMLIAKWGADQLTRSGVSVNIGKETLQFVKQPNGTFTPPANCTATLTQTNSSYSLLLRHANQFNFDTQGRLSNIVDQYSQPLTVSYVNSTSTLPSVVTDWKSRTLTFHYTGTNLTSVSDNGTQSRSVSYGRNASGDLTTYTDPEGKANTYVYDTNHQIIATIDPQSRLVVSNLYDTQGHVTTQFNQGNTNRAWHLYWSGWRTAEVDPQGGERDFFFDDQARVTASIDQLGHVAAVSYDGQSHVIQTVSPMNETNQFSFDGNNNLTNKLDPLGFPTRYKYDNQNNLVCVIDSRGNSNTFGYNTQFSILNATNGAGDVVTLVYNPDGTLLSKTDAGGMTTYGYDSKGMLNNIAYPGGFGSESFVNSPIGNPTSHTDANGNTTTFQYNNRRQLTNTISPGNITTKVGFDDSGNQATITDARNNVISSTWSPTGKLLTMTYPTTAQGTPIATNIYDSRDWLTNANTPGMLPAIYTNDPAGRAIVAVDQLKRPTTTAYDANGRKQFTVNPAGETNSQTWDARGGLLRSTDGAGRFSTRTYDGAGNQVALTNRNGKTWRFGFDGANRLTNTAMPSGRSFSQTFNHLGLIATSKDARNQTTSFSYDARGRLTNRTDSLSTSYSYDGNNNRTNVSENGKSIQSTYDALNRISTYRDANGFLIQYQYDANGNLTNLIYPGGKNVAYFYDNLNRLTNVVDWAQRRTTITYDLVSRVKSITRPNGTYRTMSYDVAGQTTNILEQMANSLPIVLFRFNWTNSGTMAWEFAAPIPHPKILPIRTMSYDDDNVLSSVNSTSVTNDANGNLTFGPLTNQTFVSYAYDARNRLLSAGGVSNGYDATGNRISQTIGTNTTVYVINPNSKLSQVLMRIKNGVTNYYVYGMGLLYEADDSGNTKTYHYDYRGSTVAITAGNGLVTDRIEYSTYGLTTYRTGITDTPFLFNGRFGVMTDANGLLYMRARYYNPYLCRFLNPDPSGFAGGLNWCAYANGNPVGLIDPHGTYAGVDDIAAIGIGAGIGLAAQGIADLYNGNLSDASHYFASAAGGAVTGEATLLAGPAGWGFGNIAASTVGSGAGAFTTSFIRQTADVYEGSQDAFSFRLAALETRAGAVAGGAFAVVGSAVGAWIANDFEVTSMTFVGSKRGADLSGYGPPFHMVYSAGGVAAHASGEEFFDMTTELLPWERFKAFGRNAWFSFELPVADSAAVTATDLPAWSCVTGAMSSFGRGWFNATGADIGNYVGLGAYSTVRNIPK